MFLKLRVNHKPVFNEPYINSFFTATSQAAGQGLKTQVPERRWGWDRKQDWKQRECRDKRLCPTPRVCQNIPLAGTEFNLSVMCRKFCWFSWEWVMTKKWGPKPNCRKPVNGQKAAKSSGCGGPHPHPSNGTHHWLRLKHSFIVLDMQSTGGLTRPSHGSYCKN